MLKKLAIVIGIAIGLFLAEPAFSYSYIFNPFTSKLDNVGCSGTNCNLTSSTVVTIGTTTYPDNVPLILGTTGQSRFVYDTSGLPTTTGLFEAYSAASGTLNGFFIVPSSSIGTGFANIISGNLPVSSSTVEFLESTPDFGIGGMGIIGNVGGMIVNDTNTTLFSASGPILVSGDEHVQNLLTANSGYLSNLRYQSTSATRSVLTPMDGLGDVSWQPLTSVTNTANSWSQSQTFNGMVTFNQNAIFNNNAAFNTITSGTWQGSIIGQQYGGTGTSSIGWTGFPFVNNGTWSPSSTISASYLPNTIAYLPNNQIFTGRNQFNSTTDFLGNVGIGFSNSQQANYPLTVSGSVAFGSATTIAALGTNSIAGGDNATTNGQGDVAIGENVTASQTSSVVFGTQNNANAQNSFVANESNTANSTDCTVFGTHNVCSGTAGFVMGASNTSSANEAFAGGSFNIASGNNSVALGSKLTVSGSNSIGFNMDSNIPETISANKVAAFTNGFFDIGTTTASYDLTAVGNVSLGNSQTANAPSGVDAFAFGDNNIVLATDSIAIGSSNEIYSGADNSGAIGTGNGIQGINGFCANADCFLGPAAQYSTGFGLFANVYSKYSSAFNYQSVINAGADYSDAFGANATINTPNGFLVSLSTAGATLAQTSTFAIMNGKVGIGTTTPAQALSIAGNALATGYISAGTSNTYGSMTAVGGTPFSTMPYDTASMGTIDSASHGWFGNGFAFSNYSSGGKVFSMVYNGDRAYFGDALTATTWQELNSTGLSLGAGDPVNKLDVRGGAAIGTYSGVNTAPSGGLIVSGNVGIATTTASDALDVNGYAMFKQVYGGLAQNTDGSSSGTNLTLTTQGTYYAWNNASSTLTNVSGSGYMTAVDTTNTTSTLTVGTSGTGTYMVGFDSSIFISGGSNDFIHCAVFVNGVQQKQIKGEMKFVAGGSTEHTCSAAPFPIHLNASDVVDLRYADESAAGTTITFQQVQLTANRIGY